MPDHASSSDAHRAQVEARQRRLFFDNSLITNPFLFLHRIQRPAAALLRPARSYWGAGTTATAKDAVVHLPGRILTVAVFMLLPLIRRRGR